MAALTQVKLETITRDEFEEIVRAWANLDRIRQDIGTFLSAKARASGSWNSMNGDFVSFIDETGITMADIESHDDGEWDSNPFHITVDELLDMQTSFEQFIAIAAVADELRTAQQEARSKEAREAQYKKLKEEFEGGLT